MGTSALRVYCGDSGATFSGCPPQVMNLLLLDMKAIGMTPSFSFLFGTGLCLIPQTGDSLFTWLLSGLLGWIMFQFSKRIHLLERAFSLISWLRVFRFCPVNHVAGVKRCQPLFLWGCMAFKGLGTGPRADVIWLPQQLEPEPFLQLFDAS